MLSSLILSKFLGVNLPSFDIEDVHWRSHESDENSLLFYKIGGDENSVGLFQERMKNASFSWLIVNRAVEGMPENSTVLFEEKWPTFQKQILDELYPLPDIKLIAITGTNGKTTTTDLILQLGHLLGKKGLSIGTLGIREYQKTILDFGLTSPSFIDLRKFLNRYGKDKEFCVMEASSHALIQDRLHGLKFDGAGWLSFSQDHLDYHQTMEAYFDAKCLLYSQLKDKACIYIPTEQKDLFGNLLKVSEKTLKAPALSRPVPLFFKTKFNRENLEVALAIVEETLGQTQNIDLNLLTPPDGRFYIKPYGSNFIVVDFAHTPDALENICRGLKETFPDHRLKVLFGCGGDRDRSKRPKMAQVVSSWADEIYVTSDNPRSENPAQIIADIVSGIKDKKFVTIVDRPQAVHQAFAELKEKEVLLLAGKGHEDYILINGIKHPYSDIREVDAFIARTIK